MQAACAWSSGVVDCCHCIVDMITDQHNAVKGCPGVRLTTPEGALGVPHPTTFTATDPLFAATDTPSIKIKVPLGVVGLLSSAAHAIDCAPFGEVAAAAGAHEMLSGWPRSTVRSDAAPHAGGTRGVTLAAHVEPLDRVSSPNTASVTVQINPPQCSR
eukprot:m.72973 g.72973  ORF g.72973 m.72973 type:complete len:158 (-) comp10181_c0_seq1:1638-2111(-)